MRAGQSRKRDANEAEIVDALEAIGVTVARLSEKGIGDLLCWHWREGLRSVEVKNPQGKNRITEAQAASRIPCCVVRSVAEALALYGVKA